MTSKTITVAAYTRKDGTKVSAYTYIRMVKDAIDEATELANAKNVSQGAKILLKRNKLDQLTDYLNQKGADPTQITIATRKKIFGSGIDWDVLASPEWTRKK